jgi:hypothetical protein
LSRLECHGGGEVPVSQMSGVRSRQGCGSGDRPLFGEAHSWRGNRDCLPAAHAPEGKEPNRVQPEIGKEGRLNIVHGKELVKGRHFSIKPEYCLI